MGDRSIRYWHVLFFKRDVEALKTYIQFARHIPNEVRKGLYQVTFWTELPLTSREQFIILMATNPVQYIFNQKEEKVTNE